MVWPIPFLINMLTDLKANRIALEGTPRSAAWSHLGLYCLPMSHKKDARRNCVNVPCSKQNRLSMGSQLRTSQVWSPTLLQLVKIFVAKRVINSKQCFLSETSAFGQNLFHSLFFGLVSDGKLVSILPSMHFPTKSDTKQDYSFNFYVHPQKQARSLKFWI